MPGDPFYLTKRWKKLRAQVIRRDGYICQECKAKCLGKKHNKPAPEVDHIHQRKTHPHLAYDPSNLRTLCKPCHSRRTMLDNIGNTKPKIGIDGYPVESA
jgi:5-methylcytosine-specific restriction endonuclease McrA